MLVEDPGGKEGCPEGAAEPRMLDGDVHFVSKQHDAAQIQPDACPASQLIYTTGNGRRDGPRSFWNNDVNCLLLTPSFCPSHSLLLVVLPPPFKHLSWYVSKLLLLFHSQRHRMDYSTGFKQEKLCHVGSRVPNGLLVSWHKYCEPSKLALCQGRLGCLCPDMRSELSLWLFVFGKVLGAWPVCLLNGAGIILHGQPP